MHEEAPLGMAGIATFADDAMHSAARTRFICDACFVPPVIMRVFNFLPRHAFDFPIDRDATRAASAIGCVMWDAISRLLWRTLPL
jgi:hypothetical protein